MRSIVLALALAAPMSAVAAPNTFTRPTRMHEEKPQVVSMTIANYTAQTREVLVGRTLYKLPFATEQRIYVPVGSTLREYCETNSKVNGLVLLQVSASDNERSIVLK